MGSLGGFETENLSVSPQLGPSLFASVTSWSVRPLLPAPLRALGVRRAGNSLVQNLGEQRQREDPFRP